MNNHNILFKVMAGHEIGMGHIYRSLDLAGELQKGLNGRIYFHYAGDNRIANMIQSGFPIIPYEDRQNDIEYLIKAVKKYNIDILVIDQIEECNDLCRYVKETDNRIKIVALDYFNYNNPYIDVIINLFNQNAAVPDPGAHFRGQYYEGLQFAIIRSPFIPYIKKKRKISKSAEDIIITFGGSDSRGNTQEIQDLLDEITSIRRIHVVVGPLFRDRQILIDELQHHARYHVHVEPRHMEELIFHADLGFIGSGTTLLEFCALGTPAIILPQNTSEERFARMFSRAGAVFCLNDYRIEDRDGFIQDLINDQALRAFMSSNQKKMIDGRGKNRIKKIIYSQFNI